MNAMTRIWARAVGDSDSEQTVISLLRHCQKGFGNSPGGVGFSPGLLVTLRTYCGSEYGTYGTVGTVGTYRSTYRRYGTVGTVL